ncbi:MAG: sulfur carrier protein ThiS [Dehalococcoidia bacterium]|jgi:thiamine biosynthesis protein ThiS
MIAVTVNGKPREVEDETDLAGLLRSLEVDGRGVAVARNAEIVPRETYATVTLREGDSIEIVRMVGGG